MAETTPIEWCDATWSPWEGCTKVSPGCDHCYAEGMNRWLRKGENWGPGAPRREYSAAHWEKPLRWQERLAKAGARMRVFPSVCDPFDNEVDPALRARFFSLILVTPNIDWLLLTKRVGNVVPMLRELAHGSDPDLSLLDMMPLPNVRIGATFVNQPEVDRDIGKLRALPCPNFASFEPLLGPIVIPKLCDAGSVPGPGGVGGVTCTRCDGLQRYGCLGLDWVIAGGESGRGARPAHPEWFRSLRDQCAAAGVAFHFKQWGEWAPVQHDLRLTRDSVHYWTDDELSGRIRKKAAGRLLDGVEHNGFPEVPW